MIGGAIGLAASLLAARFLATLLYGVARFDPSLSFSLSSARRSCSSSRPGWLPVCLPARRASRADPLVALRTDRS